MFTLQTLILKQKKMENNEVQGYYLFIKLRLGKIILGSYSFLVVIYMHPTIANDFNKRSTPFGAVKIIKSPQEITIDEIISRIMV